MPPFSNDLPSRSDIVDLAAHLLRTVSDDDLHADAARLAQTLAPLPHPSRTPPHPSKEQHQP